MATVQKDTYDAVVVGAGISGLVCGCYLAKAGMKVLIAEQHHKPGGYCSSFRRKEFLFDAAAHSFGGYRQGGPLRNILSDLKIEESCRIRRYNPSDIVITPDFQVTFWNDFRDTISNIVSIFPSEESAVTQFFNFLTSMNRSALLKLRNKSFEYILNSFFSNNDLMNAISLPLLGNGGVPPSLLHAFTGISLFTECLLDGGYYPQEGMQALPNALALFIKQRGGTILYGRSVEKILCVNNKVTGIRLDSDESFLAEYVISAGDVSNTFKTLLGKGIVGKDFIHKLEAMVPSLSFFIVYIGIDKPFKGLPSEGTNTWYLPYYDLNRVYHHIKRSDFKGAEMFLLRVSPDKRTIVAFTNAPYKTRPFWKRNKIKMANNLLEKLERLIPNLRNHIVYLDAATPVTLHDYTLNYKGAAYGWAYMPEQLFDPDFSHKSKIRGLYLTGHWTTQAQGIPGVAHLGYNTAKAILNSLKN